MGREIFRSLRGTNVFPINWERKFFASKFLLKLDFIHSIEVGNIIDESILGIVRKWRKEKMRDKIDILFFFFIRI